MVDESKGTASVHLMKLSSVVNGVVVFEPIKKPIRHFVPLFFPRKEKEKESPFVSSFMNNLIFQVCGWND